MKFGVFYEHQIPRPWHKDSEYEHFQNALTQIELADKLVRLRLAGGTPLRNTPTAPRPQRF